MKSDNVRIILHAVGAVILAAVGYLGIPLLSYALFPGMSLLTQYLVNAVSQVFLFALPGLLLISARPERWQSFRDSLKRPSVETTGFCMLGAVGATIAVSLVVLMWQPYAEKLLGGPELTPPLPTPGNAGEWALSLLCMAVVPALCEELFFRGFLHTALMKRFPRMALWITAIVFAALHLELTSFPGLLLVGWVLGMLREKRGLAAGMLFHAMYNSVVLILSTSAAGIGYAGMLLSILAFVFSVRHLNKEEENNAVDGTGM